MFLAAALVAACGGSQQKRPAPATPVRVAKVTTIDAPVNVMASGIVEPEQTVAVTAQISGSLLDVAFKEGDVVQKGQVLFHIDPRPLQAAVDQARAALARDEANAEASRRDDERYKRLADMGYVSRSQSDQMHATAVAQAATVKADEAALRSAEVNLGFATIRASISGRTGSLLVRPGNNVGPTSGPLVVINQLQPVLVRFPVLEQDFDALQRAVAMHPLSVVAAAGDSTPTSERGTLSFLDNAVDSLTGTVTGKAVFDNFGHRMWPGELVFLTVQLDVQHGVLAVPSDAVLTGQQGPYVYIVDPTGTAQTRTVAPGIQLADMTVINRGLAAGEQVVIDGQSRLNPGGRVAIMKGGGDTSSTGAMRQAAGDVANSSYPDGSNNSNNTIVAGRAGASGSAATAVRGSGVSPPTVAPQPGNAARPAPSTSAQTQTQVPNSATTPTNARTPTGATNPAGTSAAPGTTRPPSAGTPTTRTTPTRPPTTGGIRP